MLTRLTIVCAWLVFFASNASAGSLLDFQRSLLSPAHHSLSGQFIVHDPPPAEDFIIGVENATNLVRLDPTLAAVSCERIKLALLAELGAHDRWRDKIFLDLHHTQSLNENIIVAPVRFDNEWLYRVQLPDLMDRSRFVSAMVQVLLLEMANRNVSQSAEIPMWLVQGLSREIELSSQTELVVTPPRNNVSGTPLRYIFNSSRRTNPLTQAHADLHSLPPLTLEQLSWPADGQFVGDAAEAYRSSAQLFVDDLLQLNDGHECLMAFIFELPQHLNWQIAFLHAFRSHFASELELDKWWALCVVQFTGRDLAQTWPADESWYKLDEILRPVVEVRPASNGSPVRSQVTLETIITEWDKPRQKEVLREKSQQLAILRVRVSQEFVFLVDEYRRTLDEYLNRRDNTVYVPFGKSIFPPRIDSFARDTLRDLADLDNRRAQLRPKSPPPQPAQPFADAPAR